MDDNIQMSLMSKSHFLGKSNIELEEMVLATFVNFPDSYFKVADQLTIREFSDTRTRYIYLAVKELSEVSKIDLATVTDKLIQKKYTNVVEKQMNGFDLTIYLNGICDRVDSDEHLLEHTSILNGYAKRRELTELGNEIITSCNNMDDPQDVINKINTKVVDIQEMGDVEEFDLNAENRKVLASLEPIKDQGKLVRSFIDKLDEIIHCIEPTEVFVIAAAPSMGKTAFALEIFKNNIMNDIPCAFFSLEMGTTQLLNRMYANESGIPLNKIRSRLFTSEERQRFNQTIGLFENKKFIIDSKSRKLSHISNKIRKLVMRHGCRLIMIDYLQLMSCDVGKTNNREQEIATISRTIKELANELNVAIVPLSQINRAIHSRANKRPTLGDLRESGSIEQDADMVAFVHRPAYFDISGGIPEIEYAEIILAKGRSTGIGMAEVAYQAKLTKFISKSTEEMQGLRDDQLGPIDNNTNFDNETEISAH